MLITYTRWLFNLRLTPFNLLRPFPRPLPFSTSSTPLPDHSINDAVEQTTAHQVSSLLKKPKWDENHLLKSLVSHMSPFAAFRVLQLHSNDNNIELAVRFFKWVCKYSTYCCDLDGKIELLKLAVEAKLFVLAHKAVILVVNDCCESENGGGVLKLLDVLDEMRKNAGFVLNYPCYSTLLLHLAKLGMGFHAYCLYRGMVGDGFSVGKIDYRNLVNALCKCGLVQSAEMFVSCILKFGFELDTHICTSLVLGSCRVGDLLEAFRVFDTMSQEQGCHPNQVTYTILIHGMCQAGRLTDAFRMKKDMGERGYQLTSRTFTVLIKALCDVGSMGLALDMMTEMASKGCKPNLFTYTVLIDGLSKEGKIEEANGLFRKMLKDGLHPETVTYNALINGYCKEGRVMMAFELLSLMEKRKCRPNTRTFNALIEGLCRIQMSDKAFLLLRRMVEKGFHPNSISYNILIDGFCKEGQLEMAFRIYNSVYLVCLWPDCFTFTALIDGLCKHGRLQEADGLLGLMTKKGISPDEVTYSALLDGYCKCGRTDDACMILESLIENRSLSTCHAFNSLLDMFGKKNRLNVEDAVFGKLLKYGLVPSVVTYTCLVEALSRSSKTDDSFRVVELMQADGSHPNVYTYTILIHALCHSGNILEAEKILQHMLNSGIGPNHITYSIMVSAYVRAGMVDPAFNFVGIMLKNGCKLNSNICHHLLVGFLSANGYNDAPELRSMTLKEHSGSYSSNFSFHKLDIEDALMVLDNFERYFGPVTEFYTFIIVGFFRVGKYAEATYLAQDMLRHKLCPDKAVFDCIIKSYSMEGKHDVCLKLLRTFQDNGFEPPLSSCCRVIPALCREGKILEAQTLVSWLLTYAGVEDKRAMAPYLEFLLDEDGPNIGIELMALLEKIYGGELPII